MAIYTEDSDASYKHFMKIGKGTVYDKQRAFESKLKLLADKSKEKLIKQISIKDEKGEYSFEKGYQNLIDWYRRTTLSPRRLKQSVKQHFQEFNLPDNMEQLIQRVNADFGNILSDEAKSMLPPFAYQYTSSHKRHILRQAILDARDPQSVYQATTMEGLVQELRKTLSFNISNDQIA